MDDNRRNFSRVDFESTVVLTSGGQEYRAELVDISLKGALILSSQASSLTTGVSCNLEFTLGSAEIELKIESTVVYKQDDKLGLKFENIDLESITHLRRLVELNIGDSDRIQKELFFLVRNEDH